MRFGRDEWLLLKPEDNGGFEMIENENSENPDIPEDPVDDTQKNTTI